jgi:hypothetical protein
MLTTERMGRPVAPTRSPPANLRGDRAHARLRRADVGNDVAAVDHEWSVARLSKRGVERGAALGLVDLLSCKERRDPAWQARRVCVRDEEGERVFAEPLLRKIEEPAIPFERQPLEPVGVARKELRERRAGEGAPGLGEIGRGSEIVSMQHATIIVGASAALSGSSGSRRL